MKRFAAACCCLLFGLAACSAPPGPEAASVPAPAPSTSSAPSASSAPSVSSAPEGAKNAPPVALESLSWKSDHVALTLEATRYEAGPDNLPEGISLPQQLAQYFQNDYIREFVEEQASWGTRRYPEEYPPEMLPENLSMNYYSIASDDLNGDGISDYLIAAGFDNLLYYIGNNPIMANLFYSLPQGSYGKADLFCEQSSYRFLDSCTNGLPDLLYGYTGGWLSFDGVEDYVFPAESPELGLIHGHEGLDISYPEVNGTTARIYFSRRWGTPDNCYIAVSFKSNEDLLESPYVWAMSGEDSYALTKGNSSTGGYVTLHLRPGAALSEDEYLLFDEIQYVPAG